MHCAARNIGAFLDGNPDMIRLFPSFREEESKYFMETGIYPIMHTIAIKRSVFDENPWIAMNLLTAFEEAKQRSIERLSGVTASRIPMPWIYDDFDRLRDAGCGKEGCGSERNPGERRRCAKRILV